MSLDLNTILKDWPHENGTIKVRKIIGLDGRQKLQLRLDLGVFQMEVIGRPDGQRPHNCESLLAYHQSRAVRAEEQGANYELSPEQCTELQQEGIQYYHRYLSLFQLNDFLEAITEIKRGRDAIADFFQHSNFPELASKSSEINFLEEWLEEVRAKRPLSKVEIMQREMETAITKEMYERAAELRDAIKLLQANG